MIKWLHSKTIQLSPLRKKLPVVKTIPTLLSQTVPRIGTFQMWKVHKQCFMQCTNDTRKSKINNHVRSKLNFWWAIYWQARSESREIVVVGTISGSDKKVATSFRRLARYFLPSHYTHSAHCYLRDEPKQRQQKDVGVCVFTMCFLFYDGFRCFPLWLIRDYSCSP